MEKVNKNLEKSPEKNGEEEIPKYTEKIEWEPQSEKERLGLKIVSTLKEHGVAYFCGGYVRDLLLHQEFGLPFEPKDVDIATELTLEEIERYLNSQRLNTKRVGEQFSVVKIWTQGNEANAIDVATFREETEYRDGRHPEKVILIRDPAKDAERRDFTVNALFFDPVSKEVVDFVGGVEDLRNKILRPVGNAEERFKEDYLRMLRYVRFRAKYGFRFSKEIKGIIRKNSEVISKLPGERITQELDAILKLPRSYLAFGDLARLGLLKHILPEMDALKVVMHAKNTAYHKEGGVFRHTLESLRSFTNREYVERIKKVLGLSPTKYREEALRLFFDKYGSDIGWAVACHDLGKRTKQQRKIMPDGQEKITFKEHELDSRDMVKTIAERLRLPNDRKEKIMWLVENHLLPRDIPRLKQSKRRALLQHFWIEELLFVALADELGNFPGGTEDFDEAWQALEKERARSPEPQNLVDGDRLMQEFDLEPGPVIKKLKAVIREAQLEDKIRTAEEAIEYAREILAKYTKKNEKEGRN